MRQRYLSIMALALIMALLAGCGGSGGGSTAQQASNNVTITGKLDTTGGSFLIVQKSRFYYALWDYINPVSLAFAVGGRRVSTVVAVGSNGSYTEATPNATDGSFSISVAPGSSYVLTTLDGISTTGTIQADAASGMDTFPITTSTLSTLNLGTVILNSVTTASGSNSILTSLGTTTDISTLYTKMDDFMVRLSNVDADVNGVVDYKEGKRFNFFVQYHFKYSVAPNSGETFTYLSTLPAGSYGDPTTLTPTSYQYTLWENPVGATSALTSTVTWTGAVMHLPGAVNGVTARTIDSFQDLPNDPDFPGRFIDIFSGGSATTPLTPPAGDYFFTSGTTTLIYLKNVNTQTIDATLVNMLFPVGRITVSGGQVTSVSWQWLKKTSGGWVAATDAEVQAIVSIHLFGLFDNTGWPNNKDYKLPITAAGTYTPTSLPFTPTRAGFTWVDKAGFAYALGDY